MDTGESGPGGNRRRIALRAKEIYREAFNQTHRKTDRLFLWLLLAQWLAAILIAFIISPHAWTAAQLSVPFHLQLALLGGAVVNAVPIALIRWKPGSIVTRQAVAVAQMLWSAILIHLTGGRIETHFHVFVSLAFLSFYRDPRLLVTATGMVFADLLVRGSLWPLSEYGIANPQWWRALEHAAWVIFEDLVLYVRCLRGLREMRALSVQSSTLEFAKMDVDEQVAERTAELKATGDNYRALVENTSAIPWELNRDTCEILYVAPQIRTLFGISLQPGCGRTLLDFLHLEDREPFRRFIQNAAAGGLGGMNHLDSRILKGENQVAYIRSFVADRGDRTGTPSIWGISLDVTQQRRLEVDLAQAQKLESVGQLSAGIAHEINTPTQFIGDNIRFLQESVGEILRVINQLIPPADRSADHVLPAAQVAALLAAADMSYLLEEVPKAILQSLDGVERISRIVGAMKEFSHPAIDRTPHDLNRAIASTIIVASNEWKYVAVVNTDFDPGLPMVPVMPGAFNQVILNILVNAAHAVAECETQTPPAKGTITVTTRKVGDWAEVRISDTGCGMQEKTRERIFDPFFTTKPVGKGTGQGLAIAHDVIVKKHNGTISVESKPGAGTTFILRLPLEAHVESAAA